MNPLRDEPECKDFSDVLRLHRTDRIAEHKIRVVYWTINGAITIEEQGEPVLDEDGDEIDRIGGRLLFRAGNAIEFAAAVAEALGGKCDVA